MSEFETLLTECRPWAVRLARGLCHDRDLAEDIVQEASISAWAAFPTWGHKASFQNWLGAIVKQVCLGMSRTKRAKTISLDAILESEEDDII